MKLHCFANARECLVMQICIYTMLTVVSMETLCPLECNCWTYINRLYVECANEGLTYIPKNIPSVSEYLNLSGNALSILQNGSFSILRYLKNLDLSFNRLKSFERDCFIGLAALETLNMSHNQLLLSDITYLPGVFSPLTGLRSLNVLANCDSSMTNPRYPDTAMSDLFSLRTLAIDGLPHGKFGKGFRKLRNLSDLIISGEFGYCMLLELSNDTFADVFNQTLKHLILRQCVIDQFSPKTFEGLQILEYLDISENYNLGLKGMKNITQSLKKTNITVLIMNRINILGSPVSLDVDVVKYLTETGITSLSLNGNNFYQIAEEVAGFLPAYLQYLSVRDNRIIRAEFLAQMYVLKHLVTFDCSYQSHFTFYLNISSVTKNNEIQYFASERHSHNYFVSKNAQNVLPLPPNLQVIIANNLKLGYEVPVAYFLPNKLSFLDGSSNGLKAWTGPWFGLHHLSILNLSYNALLHLDPRSFGDMPSLKSLYLQGNQLGQSFMKDTQFLTFSNQSKLEILDLSNNKIHSIPKYIFSNLKKLKILRLKGNFLDTVSFSLSNVTKLRFLDLSNNLLTELNIQTQRDLDRISRKLRLSVDLSGNTLQCGCEQIHFLTWLQRTSVKLINSDTYNCSFINESKLPMIRSLSAIMDELNVKCITGEVILICAVGFFSLCFVLTLPIILYYKRQRLMYLYHMGRRNYNPLVNGQLDENQKRFDAYISYTDSCLDLVRRFTDYVERDRHQETLRLFIPNRDMKGGQNEKTRTISAISASFSVIVFLTEDYFHPAEKKVFEFNCAIQEAIQKKHQNIKVVIVDEIEARYIDTEILAFCRGNINDIYTNWETEDELFNCLENDIHRFKASQA